MGFLDRLLGREPRDPQGAPHGQAGHGQTGPHTGYGQNAPQPTQYPAAYPTPGAAPAYGTQDAPDPSQQGSFRQRTPDEIAVDRYRYMLRTAPPDAVEQAHAEAFARLTPEQRRQVLAELGQSVPASERAATDAPQDLARMATRAEMRQPGTLERSFGGRGGAPGFGSMVGSSLLGTVAGVVIGSAVANALFGPAFGDPTQPAAEDAAAGGEDPGAAGGGEEGGGDAGAEPGGSEAGDAGMTEAGAADGGDGGFGDFGGFDDFGGGFGEF
ncbi:hypothetical protein [Cellulosimicrobium sp. CUA-896]|uniref:hypothetical protein n=1 Tax=Cellulosimicrobium sp. CUA-896 TaxID=1517881 RepID=UPI0009619588|nr:hypothetical protein [Cellulosimicrobium sp. CUA-896]OLT53241.1 hypothetical protein BJF88_12285 [Cellulosimicrobium sp. CUA-896]